MGIKDNFQQALRELTGTDKADPARNKQQIDAMKSAVEAGDTGEFEAIRPGKDDRSFEEIERRAAAAADEYSRRQSAFDSSTYKRYESTDDSDVPPMPEGMEPVQTPDASVSAEAVQPAEVVQPQQPVQPAPAAPQQPSQGAYTPPEQNTYTNAGYDPTRRGYGSERAGYSPNMSYPNTGFYDQDMGGGYDPGVRRPGDPGYSSTPLNDPADQQKTIFTAARYGHPMNEDDEITVISRNTVIDGNVRSFANMSVDGNVKGNIETTKDIDLNGKIVGNIACNNAQMRTSQIQGNIQMKGNAYMERDTLLIGDLTSTYANINGKIKGSLDITGKAELKSDAVVFGDISASTIQVNDGAIIQGYVSTTFLNKEESKNIFPEHINIGD